ncbi:hypothetical protein [Teichococcus aestuarii]|uniref:hypothetical protein n=1 Tax=Teichococcus aestuarii TaxID=568898 RepID=UPI003607779A
MRGGSAGAVLKALRLYCSPLHSPALVYGGGRRWGVREYTGSLDFDLGNLAAGATATQVVPVPGVVGGDFVQASYTALSAFVETVPTITTSATAGAPSTVTVQFRNRHASTAIDTAAGTLFVRAVKPRL